MTARQLAQKQEFQRKQALVRHALDTGKSFREVGIDREHFCPYQLRLLDDTWTREQSNRAIRDLIAEARGLDPAGIVLYPITNGRDFGRVFHGAFSAKGSLIFTIFHGPREKLPAGEMDKWDEKHLRKFGKRLGIEGNLIVLKPLVLRDEDIRNRIKRKGAA